MKITEITVPLEIVFGEQPVYDVEIATLDGMRAPCRGIQIAVKPPIIEGGRPTIGIMAVFAVDPEADKVKRQLMVLMPGVVVGVGEKVVKHLASYLDGPRTFSLYEVLS